MLQVSQLHQYYGGSHILRGVGFFRPPGRSHLPAGAQWRR